MINNLENESIEEFVHQFMKNPDKIVLYPDRKERFKRAKRIWRKEYLQSKK